MEIKKNHLVVGGIGLAVALLVSAYLYFDISSPTVTELPGGPTVIKKGSSKIKPLPLKKDASGAVILGPSIEAQPPKSWSDVSKKSLKQLQSADTNKDGVLSLEEFNRHLGDPLATDKYLKSMFDYLDTNKDGRLSMKELSTYLDRVTPKDPPVAASASKGTTSH